MVERLEGLKPRDTLESLYLSPARERTPWVHAYADFADSGRVSYRLHPHSGAVLEDGISDGGNFFFRLHFSLLLRDPAYLGYWIVFFATLAWLVLLATGVVIHRKIFTDFFTFRAGRKPGRVSLDLHNLAGTLFLPFHFLITFSGLMIFAGWYLSLPWAIASGDGGPATVTLFNEADSYGAYSRDAAGDPAAMPPVAPMVERAERIWAGRHDEAGAMADGISLEHIGDRNAYVVVSRYFPSQRLDKGGDKVIFDAVSGEMLADFEASRVRRVRGWLEGFHFMQFDHWGVRWLFFLGGLSGCVLIASGFVYWSSARRPARGGPDPFKVTFVETMAIGSVTGLIVATGAFFVVNRLLPEREVVGGLSRQGLEIAVFFLVWVLSFLHAGLRRYAAWREQALSIAALAIAAPMLNWVTTGDHPMAALAGGVTSVASMDMLLLGSAALALWSARRLSASRSLRSDPAGQGMFAGNDLATRTQ